MKLLSKLAMGLATVGLLSCSAVDKNVVDIKKTREWPQVVKNVKKDEKRLTIERYEYDFNKKLEIIYIKEASRWVHNKKGFSLEKLHKSSEFDVLIYNHTACQALDFKTLYMTITMYDVDCDNKIDYISSVMATGLGFTLSKGDKNFGEMDKKVLESYQKLFENKKKELGQIIGKNLDSLAEEWLKEVKKD